MIPRDLPSLITAAVRTGWDLTLTQKPFDTLLTTTRGASTVAFAWWRSPTGWRIEASTINGTPTGYVHCKRLIRHEGNES